MGTAAKVTIYGKNEIEADSIARIALRELHSIENNLSTWKERSEVSRLNKDSNGKPLLASWELYSLTDSSLYFSERTFGAFDITTRPLVKLWGFLGGEPSLPGDADIEKTLELVGSDKITISDRSPRIGLKPGTEIDFAGIAKGYAVDRCAGILKNHGVTSGLVNLGGNIFAIGAPPGKDEWTIGIRNPIETDKVIGSFTLKDEAVATSGNYENFVEIDGKRYGHIIDPRTGRPVEHVLSVTVISSTALAADALSTGFFVLGPEKSAEALNKLPGVKAYFIMPKKSGAGFIGRSLGGFEDKVSFLEEIVAENEDQE
jgi:thiamine biosynthesis lipoprotein